MREPASHPTYPTPRKPRRSWIYPMTQVGIGVWLVGASRVLTGTAASPSGMLDDASLVAFLAALQCALVRGAKGRATPSRLSVLPVASLALLLFVNQLYFSFFRTNLSLASMRLAGIAFDAASSIVDLANVANVTGLLIVPIAFHLAALRALRAGLSGRPTSAAIALACGGVALAVLAGTTRHAVFISADHNPAMSLLRQGVASIRNGPPGSDEDRLEQLSGEALSLLNREAYVGYEFAGSPDHPLLQRSVAEPTATAPQLNVLVIVMESMRGLEMQGDFRKLPVTPELNALEKRAVVFPNFYYNGMTTVDGEFAILCSALPPVNAMPVYLRDQRLHIRCLPKILHEHGYSTHWISAYPATYAHKRRFLQRHGVNQIHDLQTMDSNRTRHPQVGWGMGDVDMFDQAIEKIDRFREPFFAEIMTLSNHHPFDHDYDLDFPEAFEAVRGTQHYRDYLKGTYYTDHAVGHFLEAAAARPWFGRTLFVILGDHGVRTYPQPERGITFGPVLETEIYFRGRLILYAPELLEAATHQALGGQIDVAPTILDILGLRADNTFLGASLLADLPPHRRFALMTVGHTWNARVANHYCYSTDYSCFKSVFPRCPKGVDPTFEPHTCFENATDLFATPAEPSHRALDPLERFRLLDRAERIIDLNRLLLDLDRF
jgi:phosphoglycerol transferase MdoB-like AlkP superfamily enzyme